MTEKAGKVVTEPEKKKRTRSPEYPFISLDVAIGRADQLYRAEQQHSTPLKVALKHWNYEEKSSGGLQTAAALVAYGLLKNEGLGTSRALRITPLAMRILVPPDEAEKRAAIKEAALAPKIHHQIWEKWEGNLPSDESLKHSFLTEWNPRFNAKAVNGFIKQFRNTISFAELSESDKLPSEEGETLNGRTDKSKAEGNLKKWPRDPQNKNMKETVYALPEGSLIVQWPSQLSKESVQEIKEYLKLLQRQIERSEAKVEDQGQTE